MIISIYSLDLPSHNFISDNADFEVRGQEVYAVECINLLSSKYTNEQARFNITATDPGYSGANSRVEVTVTIYDINDNPPEFQRTSNKDVVQVHESDFVSLPVSQLLHVIMLPSRRGARVFAYRDGKMSRACCVSPGGGGGGGGLRPIFSDFTIFFQKVS